MHSHDEPIQPESLDEQSEPLLSQSTKAETLDLALIQDLRHVYAEYTQSSERVWARLEQHLVERNAVHSQDLRITNSTKMQTGGITQMSSLESHPQTQPTTSRHRPNKIITQLASFLVAAALIGAAILTFAFLRQPQPSQSSKTASTTQMIAARNCISFNSVPTNLEAWNALCKSGDVVAINQSQKLANGVTITIRGAYADGNQITIWWLADTPVPGLTTGPAPTPVPGLTNNSKNLSQFSVDTLKTAQGVNLPLQDSMYQSSSAKEVQSIGIFDASSLSPHQQTVSLQLQAHASTSSTTRPEQVTFTFSLPVHMTQVITPHQTVTSNGNSITLNRVSIGATSTTMSLSATQLPLHAYQYTGLHCTLQTPGTESISVSESVQKVNGKNSSVNFELTVPANLTSRRGSWILTVKSADKSQSWIFHFTV
ncbi:MAG TPA: DUF4179 domain-containing protein [Ktedonobacteraceae bacterium]|nr:DUF4179 domain-containing protein [Ktedonobacteraceae bacterium]